MLGGVAILVVGGIVAGVLVAIGGGKKSPSASGTHASTPASSAPSTPSGGSGGTGASGLPASLTFAGAPSKVSGRETDVKTGLSWDQLGSPWTPVSSVVTLQGDFDTGQQVVTDRFKLDGQKQEWSADILGGYPGKDVGVKYTGAGSLEAYTDGAVNNVIMAKEYPSGTKMTVFASQGFTVSGKPAWLIGFKPQFHLAGVRATHDTDVAVAVDFDPSSAHKVPAIFFMTIPSDVSQLLPDITLELNSLKLQNP